LLEDFFDWKPILDEWNRVLKPGGHFVIMLPDKALYRKAVENGQSDNPSHQHESYPGELTQFFKDNYPNMFEVIYDAVTDSYNILFIAKKL